MSLRKHIGHLMFFGRFAMIGSCPLARRGGEEYMPPTSHVPVFGNQVGFMLVEVRSCVQSREVRDESYACR